MKHFCLTLFLGREREKRKGLATTTKSITFNNNFFNESHISSFRIIMNFNESRFKVVLSQFVQLWKVDRWKRENEKAAVYNNFVVMSWSKPSNRDVYWGTPKKPYLMLFLKQAAPGVVKPNSDAVQSRTEAQPVSLFWNVSSHIRVWPFGFWARGCL